MPRIKKPKPDPEVVKAEKIEGLKKKWFILAKLEKIGKTKSITRRLDDIEKEIRELQ